MSTGRNKVKASALEMQLYFIYIVPYKFSIFNLKPLIDETRKNQIPDCRFPAGNQSRNRTGSRPGSLRHLSDDS
jgi:hypothetical protein